MSANQHVHQRLSFEFRRLTPHPSAWAQLPNKVLNGCAGSSLKPLPMQLRNQTITGSCITASLINTAKQVHGWQSPAASAGHSMPCSNSIDRIKKDNSGQRLGVITTRKVLGADCATGVVQHTVPRVRIGD
jgi:hypothetical protein